MKRLRLGVLGSGRGSNFAAIQQAILAGTLTAQVEVVISDVPHAGILDLAKGWGIPTRCVQEAKYRTRLSLEMEHDVMKCLQASQVDLVILAGYLRIVQTPLLEAFPQRILNIHPSLLPEFRGLAAWKQAWMAQVSVTGCTVHYVDSGVDTGEILAQKQVLVFPEDTPESLHARIQVAEHELFPAVIQQLAEQWPESS